MNSCCPRLGQTVERFEKPSRPVTATYIHCTATSNKGFDAKQCNAYHLSLGWSCIGYHYLITSAGIIQYGRDIDRIPSAQSGYNTGSIAISLNGLEVRDFTEQQFDALRWLCNEINLAYGKTMRFRGHCEVAAKSCPVFDYRKVLRLNTYGLMVDGIIGDPPVVSPVSLKRVSVDLAQLSVGDAHPHVSVLQSLLIPHSDGIFDQRIKEAVEKFQHEQGLKVDGIVGPQTWERLLDAGDD